MLCHVHAWWAHNHPGKVVKKSASPKISVWAVSLCLPCLGNTEEWEWGDKMERTRQKWRNRQWKADWGHTLSAFLCLSLWHWSIMHWGEKWLMINHLSLHSQVKIPRSMRLAENREVINKIFNDWRLSIVLGFPAWIPIFLWLVFRISPLSRLPFMPTNYALYISPHREVAFVTAAPLSALSWWH